MNTEFLEHPENVATVSFKQNEGSFLFGVIAAKMTKSKKIGFIVGMDIPVNNDFLIGFKMELAYVDKNIKLIVKYVEKFSEKLFNDIYAGRKIAESLIKENNVDIICAVAGKTDLGIYEVIHKYNIFAIDVDVDKAIFLKVKF